MSKTSTPVNNPTTTELTVVNVDIDPNLPAEQRDDIVGAFLPYYAQLQDMEADFDALVNADVTVHTHTISKKARTMRLKYVAWRGTKGLKGVHEEKKSFYRLVGAAIDKLERTGREAAQEREVKLLEIELFRENQLQEERAETLAEYLFEGQETRKDLGKMLEEDWEIYFMGIRAKFQEAQEKEQKRVLREGRMRTSAKYALYIENYEEIVWEDLTDKRFGKLVEEAQKAHEKRETERAEAERKLKEEQEKAEKAIEHFNARVALLKGAQTQADGAYWKDRRICTAKFIKEATDEEFQEKLKEHTERFDANAKAEEAQRIAEEKAAKEREWERVKIAEERARMNAEKELADRKLREEADRQGQAREAEKAASQAPDKEKLLKFREELANMGYPECASERGQGIVKKLQSHIGKAIGYLDRNI